jgi:probable HAF family extracellular repeat protein
MWKRARASSHSLVTVAIMTFAVSAPAAEPSFTPLPFLPGATHYANTSGISGDGRVVAGYNFSGTDRQAVRWLNGAAQGLGDLEGSQYSSSATGVSGDGSVVVGTGAFTYNGRPSGQAFRWENGTMTGLGTLGPSGPNSLAGSAANGVSGDGRVVVGSSSAPGAEAVEAFRWVNGVMQGLGDLPGGAFWSTASGANQDGSVVVGGSITDAGGGTTAFRWTQAGGMVPLAGLSGTSYAYGLTPDGSTVVGFTGSDRTRRPFRWQNGVAQDLGEVVGGPIEGIAYDVSADGNTVVGAGNLPVGGSPHSAWLWDPVHGMQNLHTLLTQQYGLDLDGWTLYSATGVSDDGTTIAGYGKNPAGEVQGFLAVVPEPTAPVGSALACLALLKRRSR